MELNEILAVIQEKGLTAYEISKDVPLSEAGLLKLMKPNAKARQSTVTILEGYLRNRFPELFDSVSETTTPYERNMKPFTLDGNVLEDDFKVGALVKFLSMYHHGLKKKKAYQVYLERIEEEYENKKKVDQLRSTLSKKGNSK